MKQTRREFDRVNDQEKIQLRKDYALLFDNHFNGDYSKAVFVDESGFNLHLQRNHRRSKTGTCANTVVPTVRGRSIILLAILNIDGLQYCKTKSNSTVNGHILQSIYRSFVFIYTKKKG